MIIWMHPCGGFSCFSIYSFPQQKLPFLAEFSVKEGRPPRGKTACSTDISAFATFAWTLNFLDFPPPTYYLFFRTAFPLSLSYHTALMLTFSPGVKSSVTNSQLQLLFSSGMSSPGRLASGFGRGRNKDDVLPFPVPREKTQVGSQTAIPGDIFVEHPHGSISQDVLW